MGRRDAAAGAVAAKPGELGAREAGREGHAAEPAAWPGVAGGGGGWGVILFDSWRRRGTHDLERLVGHNLCDAIRVL
eukprot:2907366-Prymnesium_polylepis.1